MESDDSEDNEEPHFIELNATDEVIEIDQNNSNIENEIDDITFEEDYKEIESDAIQPSKDNSILVFKEHSDEVFCVSIGSSKSDNNILIASGSKDDRALVWYMNSGKICLLCSGHTESVIAVSFNHDLSLLATADMNGLVKVWNIEKAEEIWSFDVSEIQWINWHHKAPLLLAGTIDGSVWLWNVPHPHTKTLAGHGYPTTCGRFLSDGKRACIGYEDGSLKIWDLKTSSALYNVNLLSALKNKDTVSLICLSCHKEGTLVAAGYRNGIILLVNSLNGQILAELDHRNDGSNLQIGKNISSSKNKQFDEETDINDSECRIETLAFSHLVPNSNPLLAAGTGSGHLIIWDIATRILRFKLQSHESDIVKIIWHPINPHVLLTCSIDGSLAVWDVRNGKKLEILEGHSGAVMDFDITSDGEHIVAASTDHTIRIFELNI